MAGGKLSPRQKMINMMYLVLTALLALNVAKEVLNAFVVVNIGLLQQKENLDQKNETIITQLSNQVTFDSNNVHLKLVYENALKVKQVSDVLSNEIEKMKVELIQKVEGDDEAVAADKAQHPEKVDRKDDYDIPTNYFGTNNPPGNTGTANALKLKLVEYKKQLMDIAGVVLKESDQKVVLIKDLEKKLALIHTDDPVNDEEGKTWEMKYFYHMPLSAALVELTKWQNFVKGAEVDMLNFLWGEVFRETFKFDQIRAAVIPRSNFVTSGSNFEADVFLAAYSTNGSNLPVITYGTSVDSGTLQVTGGNILGNEFFKNGMGKVSFPVSGSGQKTFAGTIQMRDGAGNIKTFPFSTTYNVAPPSATVSATNLMIMYYGVENPISVSVPGVAPNNIIVNVTGGSISGSNGTYQVKPSQQNGHVVVNVSARGADGTVQSMGHYDYRIKRIPDPKLKWVNTETNSSVNKDAAVFSPIIPDMSDFLFPVYATVRSFVISFKLPDQYVSEPIQGNILTPKVQGKLKQATRGTKVYIDAKVVLPDGSSRTINGMWILN